MDILTYGFISVIVMALVQFVKRRVPAHALIILSVLSIIGAVGYNFLSELPNWDAIVEKTISIMGIANLIYNVLKESLETLDK